MRKLLLGSLILAGLTCIVFGDDQTPVGRADSPVLQAYFTRELGQLQRELALTPEQASQVKVAMEATRHGTATKTVAQVLQEVCTPAQFAAWEQMRLPFERRNAAAMADAATDEVDKTMYLSAKQRQQVEAAFSQIELANRIFHYSAHTKAEVETHLSDVAEARENALAKILTPGQLAKRTQIAQARLANPLPDMPELSLAAALPSDR